jgi:uncharacterized protein YjbI with pentapeptide repeats
MKKSSSMTTTALICLLLAPLLLFLPSPASASLPPLTGGGTFSNTLTSFTVIASYGGYTFYSRTATGVTTGTTAGIQNIQASGVVLPSGAIVEQGNITGTYAVNGVTGPIAGSFNVYAANGIDFVGQEVATGSGRLAGFHETGTYQGVISPTGPSTGTYQSVYRFGGGSIAPAVETPMSQAGGTFTANDTQVGSPVVQCGYTFITYTSDTADSGTSTGACTGVSNQLFVIYPDGNTFAFAGSCAFSGTDGSTRGSYTSEYVGQGVLATATYTAAYGLTTGAGGFTGIQGTAAFSGSHGAAATYSGWQLLPRSVGPGANLQRADLQGLVLQGDDLAGDNLQQASLANDNVGSLVFAGANLQGANLSGATLTGTPSQHTVFDKANLQYTNLDDAICGSPNHIAAFGANTNHIDLTGSSGCSPPL